VPYPDLTTKEAVKLQMGLTSSGQDALIDALITPASVAVARWAGREFALAPAPETRSFEVSDPRDRPDRRIRVRVGDLSDVPTIVSIFDRSGTAVGSPLISDVLLFPTLRRAGETIRSIEVAGGYWYGNGYRLDVTGTWGFPEVPPDVEQATIVTVRSWMRRDSSPMGAGSSGIRDVTPAEAPVFMLPIAARQLLFSYRRMGIV
jgi:hypothetical protein